MTFMVLHSNALVLYRLDYSTSIVNGEDTTDVEHKELYYVAVVSTIELVRKDAYNFVILGVSFTFTVLFHLSTILQG